MYGMLDDVMFFNRLIELILQGLGMFNHVLVNLEGFNEVIGYF